MSEQSQPAFADPAGKTFDASRSGHQLGREGGRPAGAVGRPPSLFDFDEMAARYDDWYETLDGKMHDRLQKSAVLELLPPARRGDQVLDVGCGTGHWTRFLAGLGYCATGVDISPKMIERARAKHPPQCDFTVADALRLPFRDDSFDLILAITLLEFVADAETAVAEMARCLKGGGRILLGVLNRRAPINRQRLAQAKQPYASGRLFSATELRRLLSSFPRLRMRFPASCPAPVRRRSPDRLDGNIGDSRGQSESALILAEVRP